MQVNNLITLIIFSLTVRLNAATKVFIFSRSYIIDETLTLTLAKMIISEEIRNTVYREKTLNHGQNLDTN